MNRKEELIRKYFAGELSASEEKEFSKYAAEDEEFRRMIVRANELNANLNKMFDPGFGEEDPDGESIAPGKSIRPIIYIISTAAAAIIIAIILLFSPREPSDEEIFSRYYQPFQIEQFRSSRNIPGNGRIVDLYVGKQYDELYSQLNDPDLVSLLDPRDLIIAGISCIETGDFSKAKDMFQKVPSSTYYYPVASWYLGLIELKEGNINKAFEYLDKADESLLYVNKVEQLREEIEKIQN